MKRFPTLAAVAGLLFCSCTLLKQVAASGFQKPTLTFKDARLSDITLGGATVDLVFQADNPNDQGLSLAETDYTLLVEGHKLVAGKPPAGLKIPARGSAEVTLPATVKFSELGSSLSALLSQKKVGYKAEGHVGVDTPIGLVALPFAHEGTFDLPQVPDVAVGTPRLKDLSFTGATLELPITMQNLNQFALPLAGLAGRLQISGADVGAIDVRDVGALPAKGKKLVAVPVKIRFSEALSAYRALRDGAAHIDLRGELRSGGASVPFALSKDVNLNAPEAPQPEAQPDPQQADAADAGTPDQPAPDQSAPDQSAKDSK